MAIVTYLFFNGQCAEALDFYAGVFSGQVIAKMTYGQSPTPDESKSGAGMDDKIMHGRVELAGTTIMASDAPPPHYHQPGGFSLSTNAGSAEEAERLFGALSDGGKVNMPLQETFFAHRFGMLVDRYGIPWMVIFEKDMQPQ